MYKYLLAAAAALALTAPVAAQAQQVPSYASGPSQSQSNDEQIHGRVQNFDGGYNLAVTDENGYVDNVQLHDGTIINPTGLTLAPGMVVNILGYNAGNVFDANEIDTPYTFDAGYPYYAGHPWDYYGPSISLGFFFGNTGWWHGGYGYYGGGYRGGYGYRPYGYGGYGYNHGYAYARPGYGYGGGAHAYSSSRYSTGGSAYRSGAPARLEGGRGFSGSYNGGNAGRFGGGSAPRSSGGGNAGHFSGGGGGGGGHFGGGGGGGHAGGGGGHGR